jgi:hypothetical protein
VAGGGSSAELEARLAAAEARGRALSAALGRKEAALAAAQGRLEAATRRAEEAGAAGGASASELERQVRMVSRLRGEAARKEGLLAVSGGGLGLVEVAGPQLAAIPTPAGTCLADASMPVVAGSSSGFC